MGCGEMNLYYVAEKRNKLVPLTDEEFELVNLIRASKGLGPVFQYYSWSF